MPPARSARCTRLTRGSGPGSPPSTTNCASSCAWRGARRVRCLRGRGLRMVAGRQCQPVPGSRRAWRGGEAFAAPRTRRAVERFMHFDSARYLPGDLLTKVDRASMAVSLEAREPCLDHVMARLAVALPHALEDSRRTRTSTCCKKFSRDTIRPDSSNVPSRVSPRQSRHGCAVRCASNCRTSSRRHACVPSASSIRRPFPGPWTAFCARRGMCRQPGSGSSCSCNAGPAGGCRAIGFRKHSRERAPRDRAADLIGEQSLDNDRARGGGHGRRNSSSVTVGALER